MNFTFDTALGRVGHFASLPDNDSGLVILLLQDTQVEDDEDLRLHSTLASLLATNDEADATLYERLFEDDVLVTIEDGAKVVTIDNPEWESIGGDHDNNIVKLIIGYAPDGTGTTDADIVPLLAYDFITTTIGGPITATIDNGLWRGSNPTS